MDFILHIIIELSDNQPVNHHCFLPIQCRKHLATRFTTRNKYRRTRGHIGPNIYDGLRKQRVPYIYTKVRYVVEHDPSIDRSACRKKRYEVRRTFIVRFEPYVEGFFLHLHPGGENELVRRFFKAKHLEFLATIGRNALTYIYFVRRGVTMLAPVIVAPNAFRSVTIILGESKVVGTLNAIPIFKAIDLGEVSFLYQFFVYVQFASLSALSART